MRGKKHGHLPCPADCTHTSENLLREVRQQCDMIQLKHSKRLNVAFGVWPNLVWTFITGWQSCTFHSSLRPFWEQAPDSHPIICCWRSLRWGCCVEMAIVSGQNTPNLAAVERLCVWSRHLARKITSGSEVCLSGDGSEKRVISLVDPFWHHVCPRKSSLAGTWPALITSAVGCALEGMDLSRC